MPVKRRLMPNGLPQPTDAELDILQVLWALGPSTVRQVHETIDPSGRTGYTTVLKTLQIMHQKGLADRDDSERAHVYSPALSREQTQKQFLGNMVRRVFGGSSTELVMQALGAVKPASAMELEKIRAMLDSLEEQQK